MLSTLQVAGWRTQIILLLWNPGFGKTLGQVHYCWRGLCWKSEKI